MYKLGVNFPIFKNEHFDHVIACDDGPWKEFAWGRLGHETVYIFRGGVDFPTVVNIGTPGVPKNVVISESRKFVDPYKRLADSDFHFFGSLPAHELKKQFVEQIRDYMDFAHQVSLTVGRTFSTGPIVLTQGPIDIEFGYRDSEGFFAIFDLRNKNWLYPTLRKALQQSAEMALKDLLLSVHGVYLQKPKIVKGEIKPTCVSNEYVEKFITT